MENIIERISVGPDLKNAMHYIVGQEVYNRHRITNIIESGEWFEIYVQKDEAIKLWFKVKNSNVKVTFDLDYTTST